MKHGFPDPASDAVYLRKYRRKHNSSGQLRDDGEEQQKFCKTYDPADDRCIDGILHQIPLPETYPLSRENRCRDHDRDHTKAADLNKNQNNALPEPGPEGRRIMDHKTRHTHSRTGGKHSVDQTAFFA